MEGVIISIRNVFIITLLFFILISGAAAEDNVTECDFNDSDLTIAPEWPDVVVANSNVSFNVSDEEVYITDSYFSVQVADENGLLLVGQPVYFSINGSIYNDTTDDDGNAKLKLNFSKGYYTVNYTSDGPWFGKITGSKDILIIKNTVSKLSLSYNTAYSKFKNTYTLTLKAGGMLLENRYVKIKINGKKYTKKTDENGQVSIALKLVKGKYKIKYSYAGENNINSISGSAKINVVPMPVLIKKANSITYREKASSPFKVKLTNAYGNAVSNKKVKFTIGSKVYTAKTDSKGVATITIKLSKGTHSIKVVSSATKAYSKASGTFTIYVKVLNLKGSGIWLHASDMNTVDFSKLKAKGVKHILLNSYAIEKYGKSHVEKYIQTAHKNGIKIHLWIQVFYQGEWMYPVKDGKIDYDLIKSRINYVKTFAKIKGVDGIHFDYLRFPGNAYKYSKAVDAVNYFTKHAAKAVNKINPGIIVSAAVMPEPSSMKYYYAQDIPTISKYLDVIVPMVYKGNYNAATSWITSVTKAFVKQSNGAKIWTGIQSYKSDSDLTKLSSKSLMKDAQAAITGGASGVIIFRYGIMNLINFNNL